MAPVNFTVPCSVPGIISAPVVLEAGNGETGFWTRSAPVVPSSLSGAGKVRVTLPNWLGNGWSDMPDTGAIGVVVVGGAKEAIGVIGITGVDCGCMPVDDVLVLFIPCSLVEVETMGVGMLLPVGICAGGVAGAVRTTGVVGAVGVSAAERKRLARSPIRIRVGDGG